MPEYSEYGYNEVTGFKYQGKDIELTESVMEDFLYSAYRAICCGSTLGGMTYSAKSMVKLLMEFDNGVFVRDKIKELLSLYNGLGLIEDMLMLPEYSRIEVLLGNDRRNYIQESGVALEPNFFELIFGASYLTDRNTLVKYFNVTRADYKVSPIIKMLDISVIDILQWPNLKESAKSKILKGLS